MITHKLLMGTDDLTDAFMIRRRVFIEEQGVPEYIELDSLDQTSEHIVIYDEGQPIGTGRLIVEDGRVLIGRVAVLKEYRSQKIGSIVVNELKGKAFDEGATEVHLHAQKAVQGFYEKLGFKAYGEDFEEAGIWHISMMITK
ncbi:GNAT family N-acetyltransferase [Desulfitobacterium sp.]|uniref:GNAT family N-acetyltransferase n=1 Tax=Desulfitobacterium sp. TaxID=49981 RepID=UPI002B860CAC|nr:GNAT family N-acetyltransferase [Desulfitobacterium sp.]HVJ48155.1 GNAT family N-acetyltransferase [Desulfitobacterium sp.]